MLKITIYIRFFVNRNSTFSPIHMDIFSFCPVRCIY